MNACHCMGPQSGEPVCPCQMRGVQIVNGRYVRTQDLGPAPASGMRPLKAPSVTFGGASFGERLKEANTRVRCAVTGRDLGSAD